jgi:hypothetical protein
MKVSILEDGFDGCRLVVLDFGVVGGNKGYACGFEPCWVFILEDF